MQHNSDFESGNFVEDLECSQIFKPSTALVDFLAQTEKALNLDQKISSTPTAKVGIKRNIAQSQQNLELRCTKKQKINPPPAMTDEQSKKSSETVTTNQDKKERRLKEIMTTPFAHLAHWTKMNLGKNLRDSTIFFELMKTIFNVTENEDTPVLYPMTIIILMISTFTKADLSTM